MNVTYEHKPAMTLIGFSTAIRPEEGYIKCPAFCDKAYNRKYARLWRTMQPEAPIAKAEDENECDAAEIISTMTRTGIL